MNLEKCSRIVSQFEIKGTVNHLSEIKSGLINDTYVVDTTVENKKYLLQKINTHVFQDISLLMDNIQKVLDHIKFESEKQKQKYFLQIILTSEKNTFLNIDNESWRMYNYLDAKGADESQEIKNIYKKNEEIASSFGLFHKMMNNLPFKRLHETIKDFHYLPKYLDLYKKKLNDYEYPQKVKSAETEVAFIYQWKEYVLDRYLSWKNKNIPMCVVHNDAKPSNVLIHRKDKKGIVIDLDTVMPGYRLYDIGDMIRTMATESLEDEESFEKIYIDEKLFESMVKGYLSEMRDILTTDEKKEFIFSGLYILFELGIRFLTDYLSGDIYFKVDEKKKDHNLTRARVQFTLFQSLFEQKESLFQLID